MGDMRLSNLSLINIHKQRYENLDFFKQQKEAAFNHFGLNSRRLSMLFK